MTKDKISGSVRIFKLRKKKRKMKKISLRGRTFVGTVVKVNIHKTAKVEWARSAYIKKYERYAKKRTRLNVHKPDEIDVKIGDKVKIMETRPISKTKSFIIIEVIK